MRRYLFSLTLFTVLLLTVQATPVTAQPCGIKCGSERWALKSLSDVDVDEVDVEPVSRTVHWLRTRQRPGKLPSKRRIPGIELMTFKVQAVVLEFNLQDDKDFHVVIAQPTNHKRTMIIEFPDPVCSGVCKSAFLDKMRRARDAFIAKFGMPKKSFTELDDPVLVEVEGVGFFDRMHGQRGRALPSGIELHPIIAFRALE